MESPKRNHLEGNTRWLTGVASACEIGEGMFIFCFMYFLFLEWFKSGLRGRGSELRWWGGIGGYLGVIGLDGKV